jgi:8-oxo-dGTP diphosphatase
VEPGESPAAALARELEEELGLVVVVGEQSGVVQHRYPSLWLELRCLVCRLEPDDQRLVLREHVDHRWLDRSTLHSVDWAEADVPLLEGLRARLAPGS